jgi:hypothetical protein
MVTEAGGGSVIIVVNGGSGCGDRGGDEGNGAREKG